MSFCKTMFIQEDPFSLRDSNYRAGACPSPEILCKCSSGGGGRGWESCFSNVRLHCFYLILLIICAVILSKSKATPKESLEVYIYLSNSDYTNTFKNLKTNILISLPISTVTVLTPYWHAPEYINKICLFLFQVNLFSNILFLYM